jgi:hypothetical protein
MTAIAIRPLSDSTDSLLRFAMRADATVTGLCGLLVAAAADRVAALTGLTPTQEYALGAFCVLCGLTVFILAALPNPRRAGVAVVIANIVYTVAAVVVAADEVLPLTETGMVATLATGVYTAFFALLQYFGVRRLEERH